MEIKTKFSIDQIVWFIYNEELIKEPIYSIDVLLSKGYQNEKYGIVVKNTIIFKYSNNLFDSKESFINSIK